MLAANPQLAGGGIWFPNSTSVLAIDTSFFIIVDAQTGAQSVGDFVLL